MTYTVTHPTNEIVSNEDILLYLEEYRLIQEKQNQFGDFKFRVKGWSFTLISSTLALVFSIKDRPLAIFLLLFIPILFILIEEEQRLKQRVISKRALDIELLFKFLSDKKNQNNSKRLLAQIKPHIKKIKFPLRLGHLLSHTSRRSFKSRLKELFSKSSLIHHQFQCFLFLMQLFILLIAYLIPEKQSLSYISIKDIPTSKIEIQSIPNLKLEKINTNPIDVNLRNTPEIKIKNTSPLQIKLEENTKLETKTSIQFKEKLDAKLLNKKMRNK